MPPCVVCQKDIPKDRGKRDTCSAECGCVKVAAWASYLMKNKAEIMEKALKEYGYSSTA